MPNTINSLYNANFQRFVDFADKAYATSGENTAARFTGMPKGDYKGTFASFMRTSAMKSANDQVRDNFLKTVAGMFGGEKFIPDIVRDNMKLEDFGKGKPLTARRIKLVKIAIDTLGGGKFANGSPSADRAFQRGYTAAELPKLARAATIYQQATNCTNEEAEAAALDPSSDARRLFDYGGRFTRNAEGFRAGLALMEDFKAWFTRVCADRNTGKGSLTAKNYSPEVSGLSGMAGAEKFIFEELAFNEGIALDAQDKEAVFGMARNPAARFVLRGLANGQFRSLAQMPHETRRLLFAVSDLFHPLPANGKGVKMIGQSGIFIGRVMKHAGELAALKAAGNLTREAAFDILYPDIVNKGKRDGAAADTLEDMLVERLDNSQIIRATKILADTGATLDEVLDSMEHNRPLPRAPYMATIGGSLDGYGMKGEAGIKSMRDDIYRPSMPTFSATGKEPEGVRLRYVFRFADETLECGGTTEEKAKPVMDRISAKLRELCTAAHPAQLDSVALALGQGQLGQLSCLSEFGLDANEHIPVQYAIAKDDATGAISIFIKEPENFPVKFNWTVTVAVDGTVTSTPMRIDHGQYEAKALAAAPRIAQHLPGKDAAAAVALIKDALAHCGDDLQLKDVVSQTIPGLCVTGDAKIRTLDQVKAKIDALRANLDELRRAANGNQAVEDAGAWFLAGMNGKSMPAGLIARIVKAASAEKAGGFAKLSADATPQQIAQAIADMNTAVDNTLRNAYVTDHFEGAEEMDPAREFAFSLLVAGFSKTQLQAAHAALRSETTAKMFAVMDDFNSGRYRADPEQVPNNLRRWISAESGLIVEQGTRYDLALNRLLGLPEGPIIREFRGEFDKGAFGAADLLDLLVPRAGKAREENAGKLRRDAVANAAFQEARANAVNASAKAGEGNAAQVDKLVKIALQYCNGNEDAARVVARNIDTILVTNAAALRTIDQVRERVQAVAANYAELQELSRDDPGIYEAGKHLMATLAGKTLPAGMIGRLVLAASNAKIDAIRKLSPRSPGYDIHRAVTQFRDNLMEAMEASGAERAAVGPDEKGACRNFIAALMMHRCGPALRNMQGAFGETTSKMMTFYMSISDGDYKDDLDHRTAIELENQGGSHMTHLGMLKDAIDMAADGHHGASVDPYPDDFDPDAIDAPDILGDLVDLASN